MRLPVGAAWTAATLSLECPAMPSKPHALTKSQARRIWLRAQRLDARAPFGDGPEATRAAVEHLGYVQIDTINVIERCHHHILYTRIPDYRREHLRQAQSVDKTVFEYWTHALSYVPTRDLRFFVGAMKRDRQRRSTLVQRGEASRTCARCWRRIRKDGALTIRDIDDDVLVEKDHAWASRKPSKRALQLAFYRGVRDHQRAGRHAQDLRADGPALRLGAAAEGRRRRREILDYLLDRALRSQGVVSLDSVCYLDAPRKPAIRRLIEARVRRKELVPVALEGAGKLEHWARPEALDAALRARRRAGPHPVAVRPAHHPAQAAAAVLRLRAPLRGLRAEGEARVRLLRAARAGRRRDRRRHRPQDRPRAAEAAGAEMDLGRRRLAPRSHKRRIEEELHRFERFQLAL